VKKISIGLTHPIKEGLTKVPSVTPRSAVQKKKNNVE
jgi:hypothetical protein